MTTDTHKTYRCNDLIKIIEHRLPFQYPEQVGALRAALSSVLVKVEARDPELFQEIMAFEIRCELKMSDKVQIEY